MDATLSAADLPRVVSRDEWRAARLELLAREKEATRARDALAAERRRLPMVEVEKEYRFEGPSGETTLAGLFDGRRQLIVYHFMFDPAWDEGCSGCSHVADNLPHLSHLHARDTTLVMVSRAPLAKIEAFKRRMGWTAPWVSSHGSDFNYDFHATADESVAPVEYNFRGKEELEARGEDYHAQGEQHGLSIFLHDGGRVFHTYSQYGRGVEDVLTTYHFLDLTPLGRQEGWGGTGDLGGLGQGWLRHHDRYVDTPPSGCCHGSAEAGVTAADHLLTERESPMSSPSPVADVVRRYFRASQSADRPAMEALLADDFTFTSPWDDHIGRAAYFERCWPHAGSFRFREPMKIFAEGDEAFVRYETEGKPGGTFRNTELFRVEGGQVRSIEVFFGFIPGAMEMTAEAEVAAAEGTS